MFHHVLSSALSTVFSLACAILPAAPLFVVKNLSSFGRPAPEQGERVLSQNSAAHTAKSVCIHPSQT